MIEYISRSGPPEALNCPAFICDACRRQVVGPGNIFWVVRFEGDHFGSSPLFVSHKGRCVPAVEMLLERLYPEDAGWTDPLSHEMDDFAERLAHNAVHSFADDTDGSYRDHRLVQPGGGVMPTLPGAPDTRRKALPS